MKRMDAHIGQKIAALGVKQGERLGVAVSGGVDSMVLLHSLCKLRGEMNIIIVAYHMEHGIRGQRSLDDMAFVQSECEKRGVACLTRQADVPAIAAAQGLSLETAARQARYKFLDAQDAAHIAMAHHMDDLAETVIMNLLRGSGPRGLCGIPETRGRYIRPMLGLTREQIEQYALHCGIAYVSDETNSDTGYTRNYVRQRVMPLLKEVNAGAVAHIAQAASLLAEDDAVLCALAQQTGGIMVVPGGVEIDIATLAAQMPAVQKRMVRQALAQQFGLTDIEHIHVGDVLKLAQDAKSGKRIDIGNGVTAAVVYGRLRFFIQEQPKGSDEAGGTAIAFSGPGRYVLSGREICCELFNGSPRFEEGAEYLDAGALEGASFRRRREGDRIRPLGMAGEKRLSDYLSDKKVPLHERDALVLLCRGDEILMVESVGISETAKAVPGAVLYKITFGEQRHAQ